MTDAAFRRYLYPLDSPRLTPFRGMDPYEYADAVKAEPFPASVICGWAPWHQTPFVGVSEDGVVREGIHPLQAPMAGEEAPVATMVAAARELVGALDGPQLAALRYPVDAEEWRSWSNPEFLLFDTGVRLESMATTARTAALALVEASLSSEGFALLIGAMRVNAFLGQLVDLPLLMNEGSYQFAVYGEPDERAPWGWQLFGHHCAVHCLVVEGRMAIGPVFLGTEPDVIDAGEHAGTSVLSARNELGLELMRSLPAEQRSRATSYGHLQDPAMPPGRVAPGDERHLAGAFQDNRVIPREGLCVADMPAASRELAFAVLADSAVMLPPGPRAARLREIRGALADTWLSWIGGHEPGDAFYYRLQSPVVLVELDHHCGVFLDYDTPKPFHIHSLMRTPHSNDYGRSWVRQWQQQQRP